MERQTISTLSKVNILCPDLWPNKGLLYSPVDLNMEPTETIPNPRTIVSGLAPYMPKESLLNKYVVVVNNMKPSKFRGVLSQGMLLAAGKGDKVELLHPPAASQLGERVYLSNVNMGAADPVLKPKQRVFEQVAQDLKTNASRTATYKGHELFTSAGPVTCESIIDGQIS
ncbi:hypothetical protein CLU79DRAFT_771694 [Phycomyces nitens]|nr:hypothetical protein CLU79DRAFT_771694 [Phycomyces nitens]